MVENMAIASVQSTRFIEPRPIIDTAVKALNTTFRICVIAADCGLSLALFSSGGCFLAVWWFPRWLAPEALAGVIGRMLSSVHGVPNLLCVVGNRT
jgi:hypothetical protein